MYGNIWNAIISAGHLKANSHKLCHSHAVPMPVPCHAMPKRVYIVSSPSDLHSAVVFDSHMACRAVPRPCRSESDFSRPRHSAAWAWHGMCELDRPSRDGMWVTCPRSASSDYHAELHEGCYQKHTNLLNCRTSSSEISAYHADFHEGHGTVGEWQGSGMACVN
jgi:hypothetical protein